MDDREIVQWWPFMEAAIQHYSGETLRAFTIHALFPLSIFTEPLQYSALAAAVYRAKPESV